MSQVCVVSAVIQASFVELTPLCFSGAIFFGSFVLRDMFYALWRLAMERQSLKYSVNKLVTYILYYCAGPGCLIVLIYYCKLCCFLYHGCRIYLCLAREAVVFLVESYKTVIERRSYVSFITIIKLFDLPVWSFWHCKSKDPVSVTCKFVDCFECCLWFCSGKSSEVRSSSYDCLSSSMLWSSLLLYGMLLGFLGTVDSSSSVTVGGSLSLAAQAIDHFRFFCFIPPSLGAKLEY